MIHLDERRVLFTAALAAALLLPTVALATDQAGAGWRLRVDGSLIDANGRADIRQEGGRTRSSVGVGGGLGVSGEYRFQPRLGFEIGLFAGGSLDTEVRVESAGRVFAGVDTLTFRSLTTGIDIHPWPGHRGDLYLGPLVAFTQYDDLRFEAFGQVARLHTDDQVNLGAVVGLDVGVGDGGWFFNANVKYLAADLRGNADDGDRFKVKFDPLITGVGFGYKF